MEHRGESLHDAAASTKYAMAHSHYGHGKSSQGYVLFKVVTCVFYCSYNLGLWLEVFLGQTGLYLKCISEPF